MCKPVRESRHRVSSALDELLLRRPAIDLAAVKATTDLQQRHEAKYVLAADTVTDLVTALASDWHVLEVAGTRSTAYHSAYFDDENFGLFRDHVQGRRLRYKVRTRRYGDSPESLLEVKLKSGRGATDKRRLARDISAGPELNDDERRWVTDTVRGAYGNRVVGPLHRVLTLEYTRRTLVNPLTSERLTIDTGLTASDPSNASISTTAPVGDAVVIEVKSSDWYGQTVRLLQHRLIRPLTFSKYCASLAALHPELDQRARQRAQRSFAMSAT